MKIIRITALIIVVFFIGYLSKSYVSGQSEEAAKREIINLMDSYFISMLRKDTRILEKILVKPYFFIQAQLMGKIYNLHIFR